MGCRSCVEIIVYGEPEIYDAFIASMKLIEHRVFKDWEGSDGLFEYFEWENHDKTSKTKLMSFGVSDVKWYDGVDEIKAWEQDFLPKAEDAGLSWEMVRVGESADDIEHSTGGDAVEYLLYTTTSIERNF